MLTQTELQEDAPVAETAIEAPASDNK